MKPHILVIDDEQEFLTCAQDLLIGWEYEIDTAQTGYEALQRISLYQYDLILLDVIMPLISGIETLKRIRKLDRNVPVVVITGNGSVENAVLAMKNGAYDYISKPIDWNKLKVIVKNAMTIRSLREEVSKLKNQIKDKYENANIIGSSMRMREVYKALDRVVDADVTVIIRGESGTGKELLARAIHFNGNRKSGTFVAVNCAAIPESLLESELFGHEKGSFTGAVAKRMGKFEQAHGGTLFLDEIGEMSSMTQAKILRALQDKRIERIGGTQSTPVDVRIISATNKDLETMVEKGEFREDLYYRISVYPIFLPPLRERREDVPQLIAFFIEKLNHKTKRKTKSVSDQALDYLMKYNWPGNVRELENVLERAMLNSNGDILLPEHFPITITSYDLADDSNGFRIDFQRAISLAHDIPSWEEVECEVCRLALKLTNRNISEAAIKLGIGRTTLYRKLKKYDLFV
ncbi:MAG: sigma-54 dependent transcriptional regulator [bacterium]